MTLTLGLELLTLEADGSVKPCPRCHLEMARLDDCCLSLPNGEKLGPFLDRLLGSGFSCAPERDGAQEGLD